MLLNNLPALCLDEIFEILYEDGLLKSLSHCAIVNRRWYTLVIPKLWRHPFYPSRAIFKESCINSIIPFLPSLTYRNNKKSIKLSPNHTQSCHNSSNNNSHNHINHKPFYNYLQYLQIFDLERIETDSRYWINENVRFAIESQYEFESEIVDESEVDNEIEEISWKFTKSLYEYFINNSLNIRTVVLGMNNNYTKRENLLSEEEEKELNIFFYPNAKTNLSKVKTLITHGEYVSGLLLTASKILRNLKEIQLILTNTNYFATTFEDLGSLIKAQKSLETMLIRCSRSKPLGFKNIFQSLIDTQLESLTSLTLENVDFHDEFPIKLFASLKYLKLERCINFGNNNKFIIINNIITAHNNNNNNNNNRNIGNCSFSKLTTLIINDCPIPSEFPEIIFSKSSKNLTCLKFLGEKTISNCSNYLTLLSNYCQNLKYFSGTIKLDQQQQMLDLIEFFKSSQNLEKITINHLKKVRTNGRSQNNIWMKKSLISSSAATKVTKTITTGGNNDDNLFNEFLPEIGKSLPSTVKTFKIKGFLSFSPDCLNQFLINCKGKLKYLGFANCEDFSSAHLGIIIDYIKNKKRSCDNCDGGEILKRLNIRNCYLIKFEDLKYARNFIKVINNFL